MNERDHNDSLYTVHYVCASVGREETATETETRENEKEMKTKKKTKEKRNA